MGLMRTSWTGAMRKRYCVVGRFGRALRSGTPSWGVGKNFQGVYSKVVGLSCEKRVDPGVGKPKGGIVEDVRRKRDAYKD
jgi:hypothetical protein